MQVLWRGKWIVSAFFFIALLAGALYALNKPNLYQAEVLLAPTSSDGQGGLGRFAGQLGGLASLAGVSLPSGGADKTTVALEVLQSRVFLKDFIHNNALEVPLTAATGWNPLTNELTIDPKIYDSAAGEWGTGADGRSLRPTDWELVNQFRNTVLSVRKDDRKGLVTLTVSFYSPDLASRWATALVSSINETMRIQDVEQAQGRISYLENKLQETTLADMQQVFFQLIESETRTVMLASAQPEYVLQTIDPAVTPEEKSGPNRKAIVAAAGAGGLVLGVIAVFLISFIRSIKAQNADRETIAKS